MFLQPILFFAAVLWVVVLTGVGIFMLFRRASHRISPRDRIIACLSMILFGIVGGAIFVGIAILLGELF